LNLYDNFVLENFGVEFFWQKSFRNGGNFWSVFRPVVWKRSMGKGAVREKGVQIRCKSLKNGGNIFSVFLVPILSHPNYASPIPPPVREEEGGEGPGGGVFRDKGWRGRGERRERGERGGRGFRFWFCCFPWRRIAHRSSLDSECGGGRGYPSSTEAFFEDHQRIQTPAASKPLAGRSRLADP